jgi:hypothetical protein
VPLLCASSPAAACVAAGPLRLVSRETAADNACFTRAGGFSRSPGAKSQPCSRALPGTRSCCITPAAPGTTLGAVPAPVPCGAAASRSRAAGTPRGTAVCHPARPGRCGQPRPSATSRDSSRADVRENPVDSSGHPTPSWEAITALLFVPPGRPPPPSWTGGQPDHCGSRIDLTAPGEENLHVLHTQPGQDAVRGPHFLRGLRPLDCQHGAAGPQ